MSEASWQACRQQPVCAFLRRTRSGQENQLYLQDRSAPGPRAQLTEHLLFSSQDFLVQKQCLLQESLPESEFLLPEKQGQPLAYFVNFFGNSLPLINNFDLNEVIESYGASVKDANIVDIIVKAKHLKDIGGAR